MVLIRPESVKAGAQAPTSVTLFDQGLADVLEASVAGLQPMQPYFLALSDNADGSGELQPLEDFTTNAAGAPDRQPLSVRSGKSCKVEQMRPAATWSSHRARRRTRATPSKYRFRRSVFAFRAALPCGDWR